MESSEKPSATAEASSKRAEELATPQELREQKSRKERRAETQRKYLAKKRQRVQSIEQENEMLRAANARLLQENDALRRLCMDPARNVQLENSAKVAAEEIQRQRLEITQLQRLLQDQGREAEGGVVVPPPAANREGSAVAADASVEAASVAGIASGSASASTVSAAAHVSQLKAMEAELKSHSDAIETLVSRVDVLEAEREEAETSVASAADAEGEADAEVDAESEAESRKRNRRAGVSASAGRSKTARSGSARANRTQGNGGKSTDPVDSLSLPRQRTL